MIILVNEIIITPTQWAVKNTIGRTFLILVTSVVTVNDKEADMYAVIKFFKSNKKVIADVTLKPENVVDVHRIDFLVLE